MKTPFDKLSASFDYQTAFAALNVPKAFAALEANHFPTATLRCDDRQGVLRITLDPMGDVHATISATPQSTLGMASFRCRTNGGGGRHERTRKALLMLAVAMKEDAEEDR